MEPPKIQSPLLSVSRMSRSELRPLGAVSPFEGRNPERVRRRCGSWADGNETEAAVE
jgi:hypothetical protein